jgi:hypothetical protein
MRLTHAGLLLAAALLSQSSLADPPPWAQGKGKGHDRGEARDENRGSDRERRGHSSSGRFEDNHRVAVREYYGEYYRSGRCPPGLAKKNNGCMPPGQAKKWRVGRPLPPGIVYYDLPQPLIARLGAPPPGYTYVRVAGDILMLAVGSQMVIDAIQDIGRF